MKKIPYFLKITRKKYFRRQNLKKRLTYGTSNTLGEKNAICDEGKGVLEV